MPAEGITPRDYADEFIIAIPFYILLVAFKDPNPEPGEVLPPPGFKTPPVPIPPPPLR
jgi:hypothetical protein